MKEVFSLRNGWAPRTIFRIVNVLFMTALIVLMLIPVVKVLSDSFDRSAAYGIRLWPQNFSTVAYQAILSNHSLYMPLLISFGTTAFGTLVGLTLCTLGAYVLRKRDLWGRKFFSMFIFVTMVFSGGIIPTFLVLKTIGMTNTLLAVTLPLALNVFNMVLMRNFFEQIPESLFESAEMDGAAPFTVFLKIVLPLSSAALASIGLFYAVEFWNSFFPYVIYISDSSLYNFQIKLRELVLSDQNMTDPALIGFSNTVKNAAVVVAMAPFLVIYPFVQKYFTEGVTMGAVKE
jgi:putative aldouronate transport system permease protein